MDKPKTVEKGISEIVGVFTDPIIVFPGGWGDTLPEWLKNAITLERLELNMKPLRGEEMTGTDAEACAYLYTAALQYLRGAKDSFLLQLFLRHEDLTMSRRYTQGLKQEEAARRKAEQPALFQF